MRILKSAAAVAAISATLVAVPLAAPAAADADGCVTDYIDGRQPYLIDLDAFTYNTVHVNPDGSIWVQPMTPVNLALYIANVERGQLVVLVKCVV